MNPVERHYRKRTIDERLLQIAGELFALAQTAHGKERFRLEQAAWHAAHAAELLDDEQPLSEKQELSEAFKLSIAQKVRGKHCPETGTAHAVNVSRFPKPSTSNTNESE